MNINRRVFLKSSGLSLLGLGAVPPFLQRLALSNSAGNKKILLTVFQRGAADGLNVVAPFGEKLYYSLRPSIAIPQPKSGDAASLLDLDGFFGLHPSLQALKPLYDEKHLALVHAVGSPDSTRSHFDAQDFMESGTPGVKSTRDGWLNRHLQTKSQPGANPFRAVALTANLPRTLRGSAPALALSRLNDFDLKTGGQNAAVKANFETMYEQSVDTVLAGAGSDAFEAIRFLKKANPSQYQPASGVQYPRSPFGASLQQVAQMIKANVGLEVAFVESNGWDHHVAEGGVRGQLASRLSDLAQGLAAFCRDVESRMDDIVLVTMSEFGRTVRENGNRGTDHGHATSLFVLGGPVRGGKVFGQWPGLQPEQLFEGRDLALTTDFRSVFSEIILKHLSNTNLDAVFPNYKMKQDQFRNFLA
ncbi:MAG: DUF1501 domain-containing protein [Acidobacteria bacterium]|nr:DUF1501 domain-containing protein [Acidobacteriota bacterium]MCI0719174.1 DUF1501 domain-containing protein [Acidobacteriota bacterium]